MANRPNPTAESNFAEPTSEPRRLSKRIHVALPIRVTYWDNDKKPGLEMSCTYDISEKGARIGNLSCVKEAGEIIAIERGRAKAFCRVVWIGESNSELRGQIGIQCVETDRTLWDAELREMEESYDPMISDVQLLQRMNLRICGATSNRRRYERFDVSGLAELMRTGPKSVHAKTVLKNLSELGCLVTKHLALPGADLKLLLNVGSYDLSLKGQVRHVDPQAGMGIEFREIRKGDRQILRFLLRKLSEKQFEDTLHFEVHA
jgi:PilZ domain-containing protein